MYSLDSKGREKSWVAEMSDCEEVWCLTVPVPIQGPDAKLILGHGGGKERSPVQPPENRNWYICFWIQDWRKRGKNSASQFSCFKHFSFMTHTKSYIHTSTMKLTLLSPWERTTESSRSPVYKNFMAGSVHLQWDALLFFYWESFTSAISLIIRNLTCLPLNDNRTTSQTAATSIFLEVKRTKV